MIDKTDLGKINRLQWWIDSTEPQKSPVQKPVVSVAHILATWRKFYKPDNNQ